MKRVVDPNAVWGHVLAVESWNFRVVAASSQRIEGEVVAGGATPGSKLNAGLYEFVPALSISRTY
jgi:hypothetical protein